MFVPFIQNAFALTQILDHQVEDIPSEWDFQQAQKEDRE